MAETRSKRTKESGDTDDTSVGGTMTQQLKFIMDKKKEEKQGQEIRDEQFLKIIEASTKKGDDEDKRREETRTAEAKERDERLRGKEDICGTFTERRGRKTRTKNLTSSLLNNNIKKYIAYSIDNRRIVYAYFKFL